MIARPVARSVARSTGRPVTGRIFANPVVAQQRVQNGDFSSATGWSGANWVIAAGTATNTPAVGNLMNTLLVPLAGGESFQLSFDVVANPNATSITVALVASGGTPVPQLIFSDGTTTGNKTASGVVSGAYDQLRIRGLDAPLAVIDNVSLLA